MSKLVGIKAYPINDSRGDKTLEVEVELDNGYKAKASVPSGGGQANVVHVVDVSVAVRNVEGDIKPKLIGLELTDQAAIDKIITDLDGTPDKSRLGANTTLAVSIAMARALAKSNSVSLFEHIGRSFDEGKSIKMPTPVFNAINGGQHADNNIDYQEFMTVPVGPPSFKEKLDAGMNIFNKLKAVLEAKGLKTGVGDEGGYAPDLDTNEMALGLLLEAIKEAGYIPGKDVFLAIDVAASFLPPTFQLTDKHYVDLLKTYPIIYLEDPLPADDWHWWTQLDIQMHEIDREGKTVFLVGDDIFSTNADRLRQGVKENVGNAILIKPNQAGTISEILDVIRVAKENNYVHIISHRAGETEDSFIADLAVGTGAGYIKAGAPNPEHRERMVKYERLAEIEQELKAEKV
ncbi:MAG: phosphopyruvate hydratase [bacterium]|nr:phosphopyruvate hydratase [bacterium]